MMIKLFENGIQSKCEYIFFLSKNVSILHIILLIFDDIYTELLTF